MSARIHLHVGPHKTGTTAIQRALSQTSGIVYPPADGGGTGHSLIARNAIGHRGIEVQPDLLLQVASAHARADLPLVLSSEEFCWAIMPGRDPRALTRLAEAYAVELIVTLTPLPGRAVSMAQEMVKHGHPVDFRSEQSLRRVVSSQPGMQPDLLQRLRALAPWAGTHFVLADPARPARLFELFSEILGVPVERGPEDHVFANRRYPYGAIAVLSLLNSLAPGSSLADLRRASVDAFEAARRRLPGLGNLDYPSLPATIHEELEAVWQRQMELVALWEQEGSARFHR